MNLYMKLLVNIFYLQDGSNSVLLVCLIVFPALRHLFIYAADKILQQQQLLQEVCPRLAHAFLFH